MQQETKDIEVGGIRYQIGRMTARDGSWILFQVLTGMLPSMLEAAMPNLPAGRSMMSEEAFSAIQAHCLSVCRRYENGLPSPVFVKPNTWPYKELEYDLTTVMALTLHALTFNLTPFFNGGGLSQLASMLPSSKPSAIQA